MDAEQQEDFASLSSFGDDDDNDNSDDEVQSYDSQDNERLVLASMRCTFSELCQVIQEMNFAAATAVARSSGNKRKNTTDDTTSRNNDPADKKTLPPELSSHVATFLTVPRIDPTQEVVAATASSQDDTFKLTGVLINDEESWWLSGEGSMPRGFGEEFVEFHFCRGTTVGSNDTTLSSPAQTTSQPPRERHLLLRRLVAVHVRIPPLPMGPLSVREFRIDVATEQQPPDALRPQILPPPPPPPPPPQQQLTPQILPPNLIWTTLPGVHVVDNRTGMQRFPIHVPVDAYGVRIVCLSNQISAFLETTDTPRRMERVGFYAVQLE